MTFVDDSIATAPERSIAALLAYHEPLVLIAGGRDKHLPMDDWAQLIARRVKHVVLLGEMSDLVADALASGDRLRGDHSRQLDGRGGAAGRRSGQSGDVVLLSPGGTSYDMYTDFEERGDDFASAWYAACEPRQCPSAASARIDPTICCWRARSRCWCWVR